MASANFVLGLKHHILNGRLSEVITMTSCDICTSHWGCLCTYHAVCNSEGKEGACGSPDPA
eukprot:1479465-Amphidinium_carterae.1